MNAQVELEFSNPPFGVRIVPKEGTQCGTLLRHLQQHGPITTMEAFNLYGITCAGQRFTDLRKFGWPVQSKTLTFPSGARVSSYFLGAK